MLSRLIQLLFAMTAAKVKELNDVNFDAEILKQDFMMVLILDPTHESTKSIILPFDTVSKTLDQWQIDVGVINIAVSPKLGERYPVRGFTFKWFVKGTAFNYHGAKEATTIASWVRAQGMR
jgi:hypothetical protein